MNITAAQLSEHFAAMNVATYSLEIDGNEVLFADAGASTGGEAVGVRIATQDGVKVIHTPVQLVVSKGWNSAEHTQLESQSYEFLIETMHRILNIEGKQEHRRAITAADAEQELRNRGFKAYTEHTGGGTFTVYCNKDGNGILMIGPISRHVGSAAMLDDSECYWGMDSLYLEDEGADFNCQDTGDIYNMFDAIAETYDRALATGKWPKHGGGECDLIQPGNPDFEELPKALTV